MNVTDHINEILGICKKYEVKKLSVFGSFLTSGFNNNSDIDLLVTFGNKKVKGSFDRYFSLKEDLELLFNRQVDLVCEEQIQNPYFNTSVEQTKQVLYAA